MPAKHNTHMLLLPITLLATTLAIFSTPFTRIFRRDYEISNSFMKSIIEDLG